MGRIQAKDIRTTTGLLVLWAVSTALSDRRRARGALRELERRGVRVETTDRFDRAAALAELSDRSPRGAA